jgi:hypothetical protein
MTTGRRVALFLGVPACLLLIANTGASLVGALGQGSFPVSYRYPSGVKSVKASVSGGQILIRQGGAGPATLTGTAHYSIVRPNITASTQGGAASYRYHCDFPYGNCSLDATLAVSPGQAVSASTDGGDAMVSGPLGQVSISTGGGNITADHVAGQLTLHTDGGDITATGVTSAQATVFSGGGNIRITFTAVPHDVHVTTDGGDITLILPPSPTGYHLTDHTDGGDVVDSSVDHNDHSHDVISASSGGGNITISQTRK